MNKIGRNDPCLCGSGKKYKKCCLNTVNAFDYEYRRQRQTAADLTARLLEYAKNSFGSPQLVRDAWDKFNGVEGVNLPDGDSSINLLFIPWFLFICEFEIENRPADPLITMAEAYWIEHEEELTEDEISFLDAAAGAPLSFYEVLEFRPSVGMRLRDLFTRQEFDVVDRSIAVDLSKGDILYCSMLEVGEIKSTLAVAPLPLPRTAKSVVLDLRKEITDSVKRDNLESADVADFDSETRFLYLALLAQILSPPQIMNSDNESFVPQKVYFDLKSVDESYHQLKDLAGEENQEQLLERATIEDGRIVAVEIPWGGNGKAREHFGDAALLGVLKLSNEALVAVVNSNERAEKIRKIIEERLGDGATYKSTVIKSIDLPFTDIWRKAPETVGRPASAFTAKEIVSGGS